MSSKSSESEKVLQKLDHNEYMVRSWFHNQVVKEEVDLGVTSSYLVRLVNEYDLVEEDLGLILEIKKLYEGKIATVRKWLRKGLTITEIYGMFVIRQADRDSNGGGYQRELSLKNIHRLCTTFPSLDYGNEEVAAIVREACDELFKEYRWLRWVGQVVRLLCDIAQDYKIADIRAAVDLLMCRSEVYDDEQVWDDDDDESGMNVSYRHRKEYKDRQDRN